MPLSYACTWEGSLSTDCLGSSGTLRMFMSWLSTISPGVYIICSLSSASDLGRKLHGASVREPWRKWVRVWLSIECSGMPLSPNSTVSCRLLDGLLVWEARVVKMPWLHKALANVCERTRIGIPGLMLTPTEFKEPVAVIEADENRPLR